MEILFQQELKLLLKQREAVARSCRLPHDLDLAHFHRFQGRLMALRRDSGAARRVHGDWHFRQEGFHQQRVGNHADVGAQPDEGDGFDAGFSVLL